MLMYKKKQLIEISIYIGLFLFVAILFLFFSLEQDKVAYAIGVIIVAMFVCMQICSFLVYLMTNKIFLQLEKLLLELIEIRKSEQRVK